MVTNEGRRPVPRAIIEVRNLRKEYPVEDETVVALDRVNLSIPQGQICCIFGESGSGKSTLLNQLAGMEKPTRGGVRIGGVPVSKLDERELAAFRQKHLGFVFQSYNLLPNLTALENVAMPLMFRGVPKEQRERAARGVLKRVGLGHRLSHYPRQMSGGQQQRVGIARAFVTKPEVVFADEPTGNLDSKTKTEVMTMICAFAHDFNQTIVLVTHDPQMASYADRIVTLLTRSHGKIRAVAKGVRRVKSRFGGRLEPFMRVDVLIATGRTLDVVSQAESISAYAAPICADYGAYGIANVMVETADKLVSAEGERAVAQYRLLVGGLNALARHAHPATAIGESYVLRALALAGWTPRLHSCVVCGRHVAVSPVAGESGDDGGAGESRMSGPMFFSPSAGGLMCSIDRTPDAKRIDPDEVVQLSAAVDGDWGVLDGAPPDARVLRFVEDWGEYYLERPIRSLRLLD